MNASELRERKRIRELVPLCTNCALCKVGTGPIPFRGPSPTNVAVLGEAPGTEEDREGKPFVGPSGKLASRWLRDAGIDPDGVAWLNTVSCFPNRNPTPREVESCKDTLAIQLHAIRPDFVLVLGGVACSRWWKVRLGDLRGMWWAIPDTEFGQNGRALAMATWHPAAVLRNPSLDRQAASDVKRFADAVVKERLYFIREKYCVICHKDEVFEFDEKGLGWCYKHHPKYSAGGGRKASFPVSKGPKPRQALGML